MPTYSAKIVKKPRDYRWCASCYHMIPAGEECIKLFGCAHQGDKPYLVHIHRDCAYRSTDPKVRALAPPIDPNILTKPLPSLA